MEEKPLFHEMNRSLRDVLKAGEPQPVYVQYFAAFIKDLRDVFFTGEKVTVSNLSVRPDQKTRIDCGRTPIFIKLPGHRRLLQGRSLSILRRG